MPSHRVRQQHPEFFTAPDEPDGYVPNVFYSCDALVHAETMVLTYGIGDAVDRVSLPELLDALSPSPTRPRCRTTLCVNNVDIASSRAFTGGLARKPLPAAMRIPLGINGFPFYPRIIGSRPLHDADARRNTGTHACAHPYRRTTTTMKRSDHQRRKYSERECDPRGYGFRGEGAPTRGGGVVDARAALRNKRTYFQKGFHGGVG